MISVCLATYNGGDMLRIQLESIITQLSDEDEVVVAEDGDVDAVRTLIARLPFANIKVIEGAHRGNAIYNFEKSILHSSGEIILTKMINGCLEKSLAWLMRLQMLTVYVVTVLLQMGSSTLLLPRFIL